MSYNGWSNYETWCVKLWLDNEEGSYHAMRSIIRRASEQGDAARELESLCEEMLPDLGASFAADLLRSAFDEVDFHEIVAAEWNELHDDDDANDDDEPSAEPIVQA